MSAMLVAVPLGLAAAVSPVMLAEQTVLVAGQGGRRAGGWFAAGTVVVLVALCAAVALLGRSVSLPRAPHLDATLDIVLGAALLLLGLVARSTRPTRDPGRDPGRPHRGGRTAGLRPLPAFGFGLFSMATNLTTLTLVLVAAKDIAASRSPEPVQLVALLTLVALASLPAWVPVLAATVGGVGPAVLASIGSFVDRHGRALVVVILVTAGALLVGRGILRLVGVLG